jgi:hypothetical protein
MKALFLQLRVAKSAPCPRGWFGRLQTTPISIPSLGVTLSFFFFFQILFIHLFTIMIWPVQVGPSKSIYKRDLILVQHQYNNCTTTPHMRVDPSMWDSPSCEGLLYSCCIGVVNLIFFYTKRTMSTN